ncbi:MAG: hypothetical protein ACK414_15225 [Gemmobacter sp.]
MALSPCKWFFRDEVAMPAHPDPFLLAQIRQLIAQDLRAASSHDDLMRRLAAKGFGLRDSDDGPMLTTLPHGRDIGPLH